MNLKTNTAILLAAAFISAGAGAAMTATADAQQGPSGSADAFALKLKINDLGKFARDINTKIDTQKALGSAETSEIKDMQAHFKKEAEETAAKIVLTQSISEKDAASLLESFTAKLGSSAPDYAVKLNGKTAYLHECQNELMTPQSAANAVLAKSVADCAVMKMQDEPKEEKTPAVAVPAVRKTEVPKVIAEQTPPPPVAVQPAPTSVPVEHSAGGMKSLMTPMNLGLAGGGLAVLSLGAFFALRRKSGTTEPTLADKGISEPPPPPPAKPRIEL